MPVFDNSVYSFPAMSVDYLTFGQSYVNSKPTTHNTDFCVSKKEPDLSVSFRLQGIINFLDLHLIME
jgi:hypothetical protein